MATLLSWVDRHHGDDALGVLGQRADDRVPADVLSGILTTDARERSGIWSTASGVLAAFRLSAALASTEPPYLDAEAFCAGRHPLYVCAAGRHQQLLAPLVVGLVSDVRDAAYERAGRAGGGPPVLLALDEAANIAPLPDLPAMVSEGAGQGLVALACLQDLSQARHRWGRRADAFLSLFGTTVVLPGIADVPTLDALSTLGGELEVPTRTVGVAATPGRPRQRTVSVAGTSGGGSRSTSPPGADRLSPGPGRRQPVGLGRASPRHTPHRRGASCAGPTGRSTATGRPGGGAAAGIAEPAPW